MNKQDVVVIISKCKLMNFKLIGEMDIRLVLLVTKRNVAALRAKIIQLGDYLSSMRGWQSISTQIKMETFSWSPSTTMTSFLISFTLNLLNLRLNSAEILNLTA